MRPSNSLNKIEQEYLSEVNTLQVDLLMIRLIPGMEMLAQELSTGSRIYEQDWVDPIHHPSPEPHSPSFRPYENECLPVEQVNPDPCPCSPDGPNAGTYQASPAQTSPFSTYECSPELRAVERRRAQHWALDTLSSFPVLLIEANKVQFYSTMDELQQAVANRSKDDLHKILLNTAHIVSVEKLVSTQAYAQNALLPDVMAGAEGKIPPLLAPRLTIEAPAYIPRLLRAEDELMFQVKAQGGQGPFKFNMLGQPPDLWISTDGWVRGFLDDEVWPTTGYREFLIRLVVQDSSIPRQTAVMDFRYRLYPRMA